MARHAPKQWRRCRNPPKRNQKPRGAVLRVASCFQHVFTHPWHQKSRPRATCPPKLCEDTYQKTPKGGARREHFFQEISCVVAAPRLAETDNRRRERQEGRQRNCKNNTRAANAPPKRTNARAQTPFRRKWAPMPRKSTRTCPGPKTFGNSIQNAHALFGQIGGATFAKLRLHFGSKWGVQIC